MVGEAVVAHLDPVVGGLHIVSFKGGPAHQAGISYHSQTPDVHLIGVSDARVI